MGMRFDERYKALAVEEVAKGFATAEAGEVHSSLRRQLRRQECWHQEFETQVATEKSEAKEHSDKKCMAELDMTQQLLTDTRVRTGERIEILTGEFREHEANASRHAHAEADAARLQRERASTKYKHLRGEFVEAGMCNKLQ